MGNNTFNISLKKEVVVVSLFITCSILYFFFGTYNFDLTPLSSIQISRATLDAADVSKRISFFYKLIGLFSVLMIATYVLVSWAANKLKIPHSQEKALLILATTGIVLRISSVYGIDCDYGANLITILFVIITGLTSLRNPKNLFSTSTNPTYLSTITITSFILTGVILFLFNSNPFVQKNSISLFFVLLTVLISATLIIKHKAQLFLRGLFLYLSPLCLSPILIFISLEFFFYFKLNYDLFISFKLVFIGLMLLFGGLMFTIKKWKSLSLSSKVLTNVLYAPSALLMFLMLTQYNPILEQSKEMFELANPAITQMRIFSFSEIPFVDFMSSHMFSEQFSGIIYNLIFGYDGSLDFLTYQFLYLVIFYFIAYYFLRNVLNSASSSLLFLISFPLVDTLFYPHLFYSILLFIAVQKTVKDQKVKNYFLLGTLTTAMCFWRLDIGVSALLATVLFLPLSLFSNQQRINFLALLKSLGLFLTLCLATFLTVFAFRESASILSNIQSFSHYISANQAHGLSIIAKEYTHQFFIHHVILPLISILLVLFSTYSLRTQREKFSEPKKYALSASIFLFLIYLTNFQRGLVRHSFAENTDSFLTSTLFIALALFIFSQLKNNNQNWKRYIYFFSISFGVIFLLKNFPIEKETSGLDQFLRQNTLTGIDTKLTAENFKGRIEGKEDFAKKAYSDLKLFLDQSIHQNQTFLDFSNTPMLYYYCQRRVPSYFCQNLQNTVDDYLQVEQIKRINANDVPVVIYSNYPKSWWDNTDDVSNIMRQYLLAEHIHKMYKPFAVINKHSIWISKKDDLDNSGFQLDKEVNTPQEYDYKNVAWLINDYVNNEAKDSFKKITLKNNLLELNNKEVLLNTEKETFEKSNLFIKIVLNKSTKSENLKVEIFSEDSLIGTNIFQTKKGKLEYMMPISNHYLWTTNSISMIKISNSDHCSAIDIQLFKDLRNEY